jgi:hypothetical protein
LKMDLNMMEILKKDFKKDQVFIKLNQWNMKEHLKKEWCQVPDLLFGLIKKVK